MKRPDEERPGPGRPEEERRRLFEESRGLSEKRALDLDEEDLTGEEPDTVEAPREEPASDENEEARETG